MISEFVAAAAVVVVVDDAATVQCECAVLLCRRRSVERLVVWVSQCVFEGCCSYTVPQANRHNTLDDSLVTIFV